VFMRHIPAHAYPIEFRGIECFRDLSVSDVRRVWSRGEHVQIPRGWSLIWETGPVDNVYLILQGTLTLTSGAGEESTWGPGEILGAVEREVSQLMIVSTTSAVEALIMPTAVFFEVCREVPALGVATGAPVRSTEDIAHKQQGQSG
jgi:hypothetical protein